MSQYDDNINKALKRLMLQARRDGIQKFAGLWGIGGDDNEHVATYRRVYSIEMDKIEEELAKLDD